MTSSNPPIKASVQNFGRDLAVNVVANLFAGGIGAGLVAAFGSIRWLWSVAFWLVAISVGVAVIVAVLRSQR